MEKLCALANDGLRVQERCEALVEVLGRPAGDCPPVAGAAIASVGAVKDQVVSDYADLAVAACRAAAAAAFVDLRDAIFAPDADQALFSEAWELDVDLVVEVYVVS